MQHPCAVPGKVIAVGLLVRWVLPNPTLAIGYGIRAHNDALYAEKSPHVVQGLG